MFESDLIWCHNCKCYVEGLYSSVDVLKPVDEQETLHCVRCFSTDVQLLDDEDEEVFSAWLAE